MFLLKFYPFTLNMFWVMLCVVSFICFWFLWLKLLYYFPRCGWYLRWHPSLFSATAKSTCRSFGNPSRQRTSSANTRISTRGRSFLCYFGSCDPGWWRFILLGAFMALQQSLMLAGTWNERRLIQNDVKIYALARSIFGFAVQREVCSVFVSVRTRFSTGKNAPLWIGFTFRLEAMSWQKGTPRRASSERGKSQWGFSAQTSVDYEPHISTDVRVLVEA